MRLRTIFLLLLAVILAVAATDVLTGTVGLFRETSARPLTASERDQYIQQEVARRWHAWPAVLIFPARLPYTGLTRTEQRAHRVGIAPETSCAAGLDAQVARILAAHGCRTVLRATYVDQSSTFAITVGVAVLESEEARLTATSRLAADDRVGVRPVAFPQTATELFGAAQRQHNGWVSTGPYIVFSAAGYTDGRTRESVPPEELLHSELRPTAQAIMGHIAQALGKQPSVPRCTQGNSC
jgi:hypothetical protein